MTMSALDVRRFRDIIREERMRRRPRLNPDSIARLESKIESARILPPEEMPDNVVTMNCVVRIREKESGTTKTLHLVYPAEADPDLLRVSILDPLGLTVIGEEVGATVAWDSPQGPKQIVIEKIHYQPESAKKYFL